MNFRDAIFRYVGKKTVLAMVIWGVVLFFGCLLVLFGSICSYGLLGGFHTFSPGKAIVDPGVGAAFGVRATLFTGASGFVLSVPDGDKKKTYRYQFSSNLTAADAANFFMYPPSGNGTASSRLETRIDPSWGRHVWAATAAFTGLVAVVVTVVIAYYLVQIRIIMRPSHRRSTKLPQPCLLLSKAMVIIGLAVVAVLGGVGTHAADTVRAEVEASITKEVTCKYHPECWSSETSFFYYGAWNIVIYFSLLLISVLCNVARPYLPGYYSTGSSAEQDSGGGEAGRPQRREDISLRTRSQARSGP